MKKLVMSALLLGALQATGCIFVASDDTGDDVPDGTGSIDVAWTLEDAGNPASCPAGATTGAINAHLEGRADPFVDLFNCSDLGGVATDLPLGNYTVWVDFTDDSGATLFAQSEAVNVTLDTDGEVITANFRVDVANGFFDVSWEISGSTCDPTESVSVLSTVGGTTEAYDDIYVCTDGEAPNVVTTAPLPIADYVVSVSLLDSNDLSIGSADPIQESILFGNEFVDLGVVTIVLD